MSVSIIVVFCIENIPNTWRAGQNTCTIINWTTMVARVVMVIPNRNKSGDPCQEENGTEGDMGSMQQESTGKHGNLRLTLVSHPVFPSQNQGLACEERDWFQT